MISLNLENGQPGEFQISGYFTYDEDITKAPLNRRGWVVQERYLARKQLSFAKNKVYWECAEVIASEQFPMGLPEYVRNVASSIKLQSPIAKPRLDFECEQDLRHGWCSLIETYSDCHLTRLSDKMIALAGLAGQFRDMTGDTYLAGLWKVDLIKQLCWTSSNDAYYPDDRKHSRSKTLRYYAPTWSWASFDGPVRSDERYYSRKHEYTCFSEILDVSVNSEDSSKLHSFVSSELQMRGIMIWAQVVRSNNYELSGETKYKVVLTGQSNSVGASGLNSTTIYIYWDDGLPSAEADPERWHRLREEQSSELLLMFVIGTIYRTRSEPKYATVNGLVLREQLLPDGDSVFVRLGAFNYEGEFLDIMATKLNLQPRDILVGGINLNDPRLAGLVHKVTII
jgi:hypothetical protein